MFPLYEDAWFTFRFADDRLIPRFHLEGVEAGQSVSVFKIDPVTSERLDQLATSVVGEGGWVHLPEPIIVRAGDAFVALPVGSQVRPVCKADQAEWLRMRTALWPDDRDEHRYEIAAFAGTRSFSWSVSLPAVAVFVAVRPSGGLSGFIEASIRPFVDGCETQPVGYVEGWYVDPDLRQQGIGRKLVAVAEQWAAAHGCKEMASDAHLENTVSLKAHQALGFDESERLVHFRKSLPARSDNTPYVSHRLTLLVVNRSFAVCKLARGSAIPLWATHGDFFSITRTADELAIVGRQEKVPVGVMCERDWLCLRLAAAKPFTVDGVLASLTPPLASAGISLFAVSTFDTDYLLVKKNNMEKAIAVLRAAGHVVETGGSEKS